MLSLGASMRLLLLALVLASACSHAPRLPLDGRVFEESEYAADLRGRILRRNADVYACYQAAAAPHPLQGHEASSILAYHPELGRFAFQGPPKDSAVKAVPPSPFRAAFEACLGPRVTAWMLPRPVGDNSGARFHFLPPGASMPPPPDPSRGPEAASESAGMDPEWSSSLFDEAGVRGYVDIAGMTRPRRLRGAEFRYTEEALAQRIEGMMKVRCIITTEGVLQDCTVLDSLPGLDQMVLETLSTFRFSPVRFRNKPVAVKYTFTFQFKLPRH